MGGGGGGLREAAGTRQSLLRAGVGAAELPGTNTCAYAHSPQVFGRPGERGKGTDQSSSSFHIRMDGTRGFGKLGLPNGPQNPISPGVGPASVHARSANGSTCPWEIETFPRGQAANSHLPLRPIVSVHTLSFTVVGYSPRTTPRPTPHHYPRHRSSEETPQGGLSRTSTIRQV